MTRRNRIAGVIGVLEEQMRILESIGLADCASLLRIAWLDLKRRDGSISIEELEAFCDRISATVPAARHTPPADSHAAGAQTGRKKRSRPVAARPSLALRSR